MKTHNLALALLLSTAFAAWSAYGAAPAVPIMLSNGMFTGSNGMALYTIDKDATGSGKSVCNDACANNWPPLVAVSDDTASGDYTIVTRDDGKKQWALKGKPLYYWAKDQKPGDKTGDGINNVWHVAKP